MQNKIVYILIAIIVIVLVVVLLGGSSGSNREATGTTNSNIVEEDRMPEVEDRADEEAEAGDVVSNTKTAAGTYEPYSPEKLARAQEGDVILFFKASWCPNCRALENNIQANLEDIPEGVSILTLDYDTETELKQKYGVTIQHTLVQVDAEGNMINKWIGSPTLGALVDEIS